MNSFVDFFGALTARLLGLVALLPAAGLIRSWIGYDLAPDLLPRFIVAVAMVIIYFTIGVILLSPAGTQRFLRRRESALGQMVRAVVTLLLVVMVLAHAATAVPRLTPEFAGLETQFTRFSVILGGLYFLLFLLPGSYARRLAVRRDPQVAVAREAIVRAARTWRDIVADVTGAATARLLGLIAAGHPLMLMAFYLRGDPIDPLSLLVVPLTSSVAVILLVPAATEYVFEPRGGRMARFGFGCAAGSPLPWP